MDIINGIADIIQSLVDAVLAGLQPIIDAVVNPIQNMITDLVDKIMNQISGALPDAPRCALAGMAGDGSSFMRACSALPLGGLVPSLR